MPHRDVIVVGASLGGWDAVPKLVSGFSETLDASVLIVMHTAMPGSNFARRLDAAGPLRAAAAKDGEELRPGRIYVAIAEHHLMVEGRSVRLSRGPRESHARPSIDVLFRSAAYSCGSRVIGIVLTGRLDDGTAGLWAIKDRGGTAIVQLPDEAAEPSMPLNATKYVDVDFKLAIKDMPAVLDSLTRETVQHLESTSMPDQRIEIETKIARGENALELGVRTLGAPSFQTCPECHGSMVAIDDGHFRRYRCHTGHAFSPAVLEERIRRSVEDTLYSALAQLEQYEVLLNELQAQRSADEGGPASGTQRTRFRNLIQQVRDLAMSIAVSTPQS